MHIQCISSETVRPCTIKDDPKLWLRVSCIMGTPHQEKTTFYYNDDIFVEKKCSDVVFLVACDPSMSEL